MSVGATQAEAEAALRSASYDPAFVLPFAAAAVHAACVDVRQCCQWGLLSMALASLASARRRRRREGYQLLAAVMAALPAADFKEKAQVRKHTQPHSLTASEEQREAE